MKIEEKSKKKFKSSKKVMYPNMLKRKKSSSSFKLMIKYIVAFLVTIVFGLILSATIFFKIDKISLTGESIYSDSELLDNVGINIGENLFFVNTKERKERVEKGLPYVETATFIRKFPNEMIIDVKNAKKEFAFNIDEKFVILSSSGKVLEICNEITDEIAQIKGIKLKQFEVGLKATYENPEQEETFKSLIKLLNLNGLNNITNFDFSNCANITINYDNRINMNLGLFESIDYKLRTAKEIINTKIGAEERGILDLSTVSKDNRSYFKPEPN